MSLVGTSSPSVCLIFIALWDGQFFPDCGYEGGHAGTHSRRKSNKTLDQASTFCAGNEANALIDW